MRSIISSVSARPVTVMELVDTYNDNAARLLFGNRSALKLVSEPVLALLHFEHGVLASLDDGFFEIKWHET